MQSNELYSGFNPFRFTDKPLWLPDIGLVGQVVGNSWGSTASYFKYCIGQYDGYTYARNQGVGSVIGMSRVRKTIIEGASGYDPVTGNLGYSWYAFDPNTGISYGDTLFYVGIGNYIIEWDTYNLVQAGMALYKVDSDTGFTTGPDQIIYTSTMSIDWCSDGGGNTVWLCSVSGGVTSLNLLTGEVHVYYIPTTFTSGGVTYTALFGAWYDQILGVIIAVYSSSDELQGICIYAIETIPVSLSNPALAIPVMGASVPVTTILTGSQGEPCPDFPVNWTNSGDGTVNPTQSITDETGTATTTYYAPLAPGSDSITAMVIAS